jgi:hypothetical protein
MGIEVQTGGTIGPLAAQHGSYHVEIVQLPTEVPLPATGVLLLAGLGVLGHGICAAARNPDFQRLILGKRSDPKGSP